MEVNLPAPLYAITQDDCCIVWRKADARNGLCTPVIGWRTMGEGAFPTNMLAAQGHLW